MFQADSVFRFSLISECATALSRGMWPASFVNRLSTLIAKFVSRATEQNTHTSTAVSPLRLNGDVHTHSVTLCISSSIQGYW